MPLDTLAKRPATPIAAPTLPRTKRAVRRLIDALDARGVRYCHWKSNVRLPETLAGAEDIDLLVRRDDAALLHAALAETGFKLCQSRSGVGHPGTFNALALDEDTAELVHLHAYYQIVSGDSLVKNYRLPLEGMLLERTRELDGVRVPASEAELLLLLVRVALKHVSLVEIAKVSRGYAKLSAELAWLLDAADPGEVERLRARWFPELEPALVGALLRGALADHGALRRRVVLGWRVARRLRRFRRLSPLSALLSRYWRLTSLALGRLRRRRDLVPTTGGTIVALVGPKASGKSTVGHQLAARLGRHLAVSRIHAGKPPATALSLVPRLFVPLARVLLPRERLGEYERPERRREKRYSLFYVLRMMLLAHDRRRLLLRAFRAATAGQVVISDRYPSETTAAIDSSCFDEEALARSGSPVKRWFMRRERALYQDLPKPHLVLRLVAPIDTAIRRDAERAKPGGPNADAIRRRWELETGVEFPGVPVVTIDSGAPLDETVRTAMRAVWGAL